MVDESLDSGRRGLAPGSASAATRRWVWFALAAAFVAIANDALSDSNSALPKSLLLLLPLGSLAALRLGFGVGNVVYGASLVLLVAYFVTHSAPTALVASSRANLLLAFLTTHLFVQRFQAAFRRASSVLERQGRVMAERVDEQARLTNTLVSEIEGELEAMRSHFGSGAGVEVSALRNEQQTLIKTLKDAQRTFSPEQTPAPIPRITRDFRTQMMCWLLIITGGETAVLAIRVWVTGHGAWLPSFLLSTLCWTLLGALSLHPQRRPLIAFVLAVSTCVTIVTAMLPWGFALPPPGTVFMITIAYHAVLIGWRFSELVIAIVTLLILAALAVLGGASTAYGLRYLATTALCAIFMQVCWRRMQTLVTRALDASRERARELEKLAVFRRRLCGTLFHDVANLAHSMGMLLSIGDVLSSEELSLFQRLHARLVQLIAAAARALEQDEPISETALASVPIDALFGDVRELFGFRLREKSQSLVYSSSGPLTVRAQTELLRDSVMANLLSNAIKFSPVGAAIELVAQRTQGKVEIIVRDCGPGFPDDLERSLNEGQRVFSTQGSAGESGLGLGLTLTLEHLRRMGGSLSLRRPPGGGSEAAIALPEA